jgi:hypothetical protein
MMIPTLACSVEPITVDSQLHPPRRGALLTDPEIFETLAARRVGSPSSIAGNFTNLDDTKAGLREILATSFAHVELEAVGLDRDLRGGRPACEKLKPSDTC